MASRCARTLPLIVTCALVSLVGCGGGSDAGSAPPSPSDAGPAPVLVGTSASTSPAPVEVAVTEPPSAPAPAPTEPPVVEPPATEAAVVEPAATEAAPAVEATEVPVAGPPAEWPEGVAFPNGIRAGQPTGPAEALVESEGANPVFVFRQGSSYPSSADVSAGMKRWLDAVGLACENFDYFAATVCSGVISTGQNVTLDLDPTAAAARITFG